MATENWSRFFEEAGIPNGVAANYAQIFKTNRIKREMLLDLTKEYLQDMGISIMGDIISILKQARVTYEKDVRGKGLSDETSESQSVSSKTATTTAVTNKVAEPVRTITVDKPRMVAVTSKPLPAAATLAKTASVSQKLAQSIPTKRKATEEMELEGPELPPSLAAAPKKKVRVIVSKAPASTAKVTVKTPTTESSSVPAPSAKTEEKMYSDRIVEAAERNRKISLAKAAAQAVQRAKKSTVFDRLGDSHVSSTTVDLEEITVEKKKSETVFDRLGGLEVKASPARASSQKPAQGIIFPASKRVTRPLVTSTIPSSVVSRLGTEKTSPVTRLVSAVPKMASDRMETSAKKRIGIAATTSHLSPRNTERVVSIGSSKKSVFSRLG